jgi:hypothetical protein
MEMPGTFGVKAMELEQRVAQLEARIASEDAIDRLEKRALRLAKTVLFIIAVSAPVVWAVSEFASYLMDRYAAVRHTFGW